MSSQTPVLRVGSFLVPGIPVEFFVTVNEYLESKLGVSSTLLYEPRYDTPKLDIEDPFATGHLDMAWMTGSAYLKLKKNSSPVQLLPIKMVHKHAKSRGCFTDIIMHKDLSDTVKEFIDLRGYGFAHDKENSYNSHVITITKLKSMGENHSSFFRKTAFTGSHHNSIKAVIGKTVEAAAVDANCLAFFLYNHPELEEELEVLTSWGPLPPYACVVRSNLPDSLKSAIQTNLCEMHTTDLGQEKLNDFGFNIEKFTNNDADEFVKFVSQHEKKDIIKISDAYY